MGIKFDRMRQRVAEAEAEAKSKGNRNVISFKDDTDTKIRLVPTNEADVPDGMKVVWVHYATAGIVPRPILSPKTFDLPDPIVEFVQHELKASQHTKEEYARLKNLEPKLAYIMKAVERGKEAEGTKLFIVNGGSRSDTVPFEPKGQYGQLLEAFTQAFADDPNPPDWDDVENGYDIKVVKKSKATSGTGYPSLAYHVARRSSPLSTDKAILNALLTEQPSWRDAYEAMDYNQLLTLLEKWTENGGDAPDADEDDDSDAFSSAPSKPSAPSREEEEKLAEAQRKLDALSAPAPTPAQEAPVPATAGADDDDTW